MRRAVPSLLLVALTAALLAPSATAQDAEGPGWLYLARLGEILAMRPDGTDVRNLTQTPDRWEDWVDKEFANTSLEIAYQYEDLVDGAPGGSGGIEVLELTEGAREQIVTTPSEAGLLQPAFSGSYRDVFHTEGNRAIVLRQTIFGPESRTQIAAAGPGQTVSLPDSQDFGNGSRSNFFTAYVRSEGQTSTLHRVDINANFGGPPEIIDTPIATGRYASATDPTFAPGSEDIMYACTLPGAADAEHHVCRSGHDQAGTGFTAIDVEVDARQPVLSPDEARIAFRGADGSVWVMNADGSGQSQLLGPSPAEDPSLGLAWGIEVDLVAAPPPPPEPEPEQPDPAPNTPLPAGGVDGDPATTDRAAFARPGPFSVAVSAARFPDSDTRGAGGAAYAILSRDDQFADSLAGSALSGDGPILFTASSSLDDLAAAELDRLLAPGATVYLLGGEAALGPAVEQAVTGLGLTPVRLAGASRFETALAIAREAVAQGASGETFLLARGTAPEGNPTAAWADSVAGGVAAAGGIPVLISTPDSLHPAVQTWVEEQGGQAVLLGGTSALSEAVADALPGSRRVAGPSRAATAVAIASDLLDIDDDGPRTALLFDGFAEDGWTFGLAAAGLAADLDAALLFAQQAQLPPETEAFLAVCGDPEVETLLLGWEGIIDPAVADLADELDGSACS